MSCYLNRLIKYMNLLAEFRRKKNEDNKSLKGGFDQLEVARVQRGGMSSAQKKGRFVQGSFPGEGDPGDPGSEASVGDEEWEEEVLWFLRLFSSPLSSDAQV